MWLLALLLSLTAGGVALFVVLPISLILLSICALLMFLKWRRLQAQRLQCLPSFVPAVAAHSGAYAAGADDWSCGNDVALFLVPRWVRHWWRVEADAVRFGQAFATILCVTATIIFPLGAFTHVYGDRSNFLPDIAGLTTAALAFALLAGLLCLITCIGRSLPFPKQRRWARVQQLHTEESMGQAQQQQQQLMHVEAGQGLPAGAGQADVEIELSEAGNGAGQVLIPYAQRI
jgi:hypothetical protein